MIQENDVVNTTGLMRELKHSKKILEDVDLLLKLKREHPSMAKSNPEEFDALCVEKCQFIFNHYTDIFNKVKKDEIDLNILLRLINVLHSIEEGDQDQHEGSFEVGKLLKQIYIDSALRKADKLNGPEGEDGEKEEEIRPVENISWRDFKQKME
jgi:hypothetical protein|tara:strand:- start:3483 stop:3944 length:462 start_codon:yes stop_codon:yes gene_type:complete